MPETEFPLVFEQLKKILKPYESKLTTTVDSPNSYSLDGPYSEKWKKAVFFGAVLLISGAGIVARYFGRVLPQQRKLSELLTEMTGQS